MYCAYSVFSVHDDEDKLRKHLHAVTDAQTHHQAGVVYVTPERERGVVDVASSRTASSASVRSALHATSHASTSRRSSIGTEQGEDALVSTDDAEASTSAFLYSMIIPDVEGMCTYPPPHCLRGFETCLLT